MFIITTENWAFYKVEFYRNAIATGRSKEYIERCFEYGENLIEKCVPVIFDAEHLAFLLGFRLDSLSRALEDPDLLYKTHFVPKKSGGYRRLSNPGRSLKQMQRWILENVLSNLEPHPAAMAFKPGSSIKQNAEIHIKAKMVLSLDVEDFFPSIKSSSVKNLFIGLGYSEDVCDLLTRLTTCSYGLPQGAPTSPYISNMVMRPLDERISTGSLKERIRYSRYADDMTFSGEFHPGFLIVNVKNVIGEYGFKLNEAKIRLMKAHERQEVTGIVVNEYLQVTRSVRRSLRQEIYYVRKYGEDSHRIRHSPLVKDKAAQLMGLATHIQFINHKDRDAKEALALLRRRTPIKKPPG